MTVVTNVVQLYTGNFLRQFTKTNFVIFAISEGFHLCCLVVSSTLPARHVAVLNFEESIRPPIVGCSCMWVELVVTDCRQRVV